MFKHKKSQLFMMLLVVVTLISFTVLYTVMLSKTDYSKNIGERQFSILKANAKAQDALFYIDQSAAYASDQALYELAFQGGIEKPVCGDNIGYVLWNNRTDNCYPEKPAEVFYGLLGPKLDKFLISYPYVGLTAGYEYSMRDKTLYGTAHDNIVVDITDDSTSGSGSKKPNGQYSIKPDFTLDLDTNFSEYKDMRIEARNLIKESMECEDTGETLDKCIRLKTNKGADWSADCGDDEEKAFTGFIGQYMLCSQSEDNYCLCEITVPDKDYELEYKKQDTGTMFTMNNREFYLGSAAPSIDNPASIWVTEDELNPVDSFNVDLSGKDAAHVTIARGSSEQKYDYGSTIPFFRVDDKLILLSQDKVDSLRKQSAADPTKELRNCPLPNKRRYDFCVDSKKTVYSYDKYSDKYGANPLIYRFALDFSDNTVPGQPTGVSAAVSDNGMTVSWTPLSEPDIDHYNIYCLDHLFEDLKLMRPSAQVEHPKSTVLITEFPSFNYFTQIARGGTYYVAVVPVDRSNNYMKENIRTVVATEKAGTGAD